MMNNNYIIGLFKDEEKLITAINTIREKGIEIRDVFMPYPVHGVNEALGLKKTKLPWAAFVFGLTGLLVTWLFVYWTSVVSYPLHYGGKPLISAPVVIIICFLMTINIGSLLTLITFFIRAKVYPGKTAEIVDLRVTDDIFAIVIDKKPDMLSSEVDTINSLLENNGAVEVKEKKHEK